MYSFHESISQVCCKRGEGASRKTRSGNCEMWIPPVYRFHNLVDSLSASTKKFRHKTPLIGPRCKCIFWGGWTPRPFRGERGGEGGQFSLGQPYREPLAGAPTSQIWCWPDEWPCSRRVSIELFAWASSGRCTMGSKNRRVAGEFADSSPERNKWRHPERCPGTPGFPGTKIATRVNEGQKTRRRSTTALRSVQFGHRYRPLIPNWYEKLSVRRGSSVIPVSRARIASAASLTFYRDFTVVHSGVIARRYSKTR